MSNTYPHRYFDSIDELCGLIDEATRGWDTKWYRGVKNPSYALLPKLLRDESLSKREGYISVEFRRRARAQLPNIQSPFEWLCAMQHYKVPTRLLDWTESLAVALYFTVRPLSLDLVAPTIWVLDPFALSKISLQSDWDTIPVALAPSIIANADLAFDELTKGEQKSVTLLPVPVVPDFIFNRLAAQNGAFTIHGKQKDPIEKIIPIDQQKYLLKFVANPSKLKSIFRSLDFIIPSSDAIFPDIEGLIDYIV